MIEELLDDTDQNKQRAAAELLAGLVGGSKHWTQKAQQRLWNWLTPLIPRALGSNVKPDTLTIWTSFLEVSMCVTFLQSSEPACSTFPGIEILGGWRH